MRSACILACLLFESFVNAQQLQWYAPGNVSPVLHGPWAYDSERDRLVIAGGYSQDGSHHPFYFRDTMEWDGVGWLARPSTSFPGRFAQQMAFDPRRRRIVMFGGLYQQPIISEHFPPGRLGDTWEYDGMQWSQRSNVGPSPRSGAAMTYDPVLQRVLLYGGNAYYNALSNETWAWDGASWTMLNVAGPPARQGPSQAYDTARNRWVIFGGGNLTTHLGDLWEWDSVAWTQRTPAVSPPPLGQGMAYDAVRRVCVLGVTDGGYPNPNIGLWEWDGTNWTQPAVPTMTHNPWMAAWHAGRGAVMFFDGANLDSWDGQTLRSVDHYGVPFSYATLATLGPRVLAVAGDTVWEWSFPAWRFVETLPSVSNEIFAVEDTVRNRVVCVLPSGSPFSFVAEFDGTTWNQTSRGSMSFSPRTSPALAFDRIRGVTVMFGGRGPSAPFQLLQETWEWNGSVFVQRASATSPSPRFGAAMCWDPQLGESLLFGGRVDDSSPPLQDTWAWNGTSWHQLAPVTQPPAVAMKLVLHESENRPWLFQSSLTGAGAWRWDGADWQPVATSTGTAMIFDRTRDQFLSINYLNNVPTTEYLTALVPQVTARGVGCGGELFASTPFLGNPALRFDAFGLPAQSLAALALGTQATNIGFGNGCTLLVGGNISVQLFLTNGGGFGSLPIPVPAALGLLGLQLHAQAFGLDATTASLVATGAQDLTIGY